jgi:hypothetical protein
MLQRITCFHLPKQSKVLLSTQGVQIGGLGTLLMVHFNASWRRQQQYPGLNALNALDQCLTSPALLHGRIGEAIMIIQGANTSCCNRGLQVHQRVISFLH